MRPLIVVFFLVASVALAQQPPPSKPQTVNFTPTEVEAGRVIPLAQIYLAPTKKTFARMIKVRMNFNDKLAQSVHEM